MGCYPHVPMWNLTDRENLMQKLDIHNTAGVTRHAISAGIIESSVQLTIV